MTDEVEWSAAATHRLVSDEPWPDESPTLGDLVVGERELLRHADDSTDPTFVLGAVLAQIEDLTRDDQMLVLTEALRVVNERTP